VSLEKLAWIGIVLLAAYLRLGHLELVEFKLDEVKHCQRALDLLQGHLPAVGSISSLGMAKPPLMTYLMAIPLAVSKDPILATGFVALLNVGAVLGCFWVTREHFGDKAGLVSSLLFAISPWAVIYSRKIFTADLMPPFAVLLLEAVLAALVKSKQNRLVLAFVWLACLIQISPSALSLVPPIALLLLIYRARVRLAPLLLGILAFIMIFSPYIYHDLTHGLANIKTLVSASRAPASFSLKSVQYSLQLISGSGCHALAGRSFEKFISERADFAWLDAVETLFFLGGLAYLAWRILKRRRQGRDTARFSIPLLWFLMPVFLNIRPSIPLYPHYFVILYPVQFVIIAVFVVEARREVHRWTSPSLHKIIPFAFWALVVAIALWQVYLTSALLRFLDRNDTTGGYGLPVKYYLRAAGTLKRLAEGSQVLILSEGDNPAWDEVPAVFDYLLRPEVSPRFVNYREALVFPRGDAIYLLAPGGARAIHLLEAHTEELAEEQIPLRGGPDAFRFYHLRAASREDLLAAWRRERRPAAFDNGLELLGYDLSGEVTSGGTLRLELRWTVRAVPDARYHFFNHLIDDEGRRWGQKDGPGYPAGQWQEGDVVVSWFDIPISSDAPPGEYWVLTGMYTYPEGVRALLLDERGQPVGDALWLGPVEVDP
jgi:4-amino-4-deoxy-L-arabinose transferase-like glycosyltransferase